MIIRHLIQDTDSITWINQMWKGAIPDLIARAKNMTKLKFSRVYILSIILFKEAEKISKIDAMAWAKKYLIDDSVDLKLSSLKIIGISLIKLISNPIHLVNQELDDTAIIVPEVKKNKKIVW